MLLPFVPLPSLEAFVRHIPAQSRRPQGGQPGVGIMPEGEEIPGQSLVLGAGRGKAETGDDTLGIDGKQQVKAFSVGKGEPNTSPGGYSSQYQPASQPAPRRFASLVGTPELSKAS